MDRKLSRRDFVKLTGVAAGSVLSGGLLNACATSQTDLFPIVGPVHYPKLPGDKVQPPKDGCYTGIFMGNHGHQRQHRQIETYEELVGKKPSFFMMPYRAHPVFTGTQIDAVIYPRNRNYQMLEEVAKKGVIPFISYDMRIGLSWKSGRNKVIKGKLNEEITVSAQWLRRYGESYGGFFIRTMREMNLSNWPWSGDPSIFKKAWKHIWNIFEAEGTNQYATWVFNPLVPDPEKRGIGTRYYPGDNYVDWIGLNGYNTDGQSWGKRRGIYQLFNFATNQYYKLHPSKPQMICETGMDNLPYKPNWVRDGLTSLRTKMPAIRGISFWSEKWSVFNTKNFDSRINSSAEALAAYREAISDPYFIGAINN